MSTTASSTPRSAEPIDISTPPPLRSPLLLYQSLPLGRIRDGPSPLTLEERIGLSAGVDSRLSVEQIMAIEEIVEGSVPIPLLTVREEGLHVTPMTNPDSSLPTMTFMIDVSQTIAVMANVSI
ncbi:hypothetical protein EI94DRAFT_1811824 [Lactarius quietus]|nr:hypothetical protein EI94DRAFT_1811824 [Lactarius quietus]